MINTELKKKMSNLALILLIALVVLQPVLDTYYLYSDKIVSIVGFSPSTIIRILLASIIFLITFILVKGKKKWYITVPYGILIGIYTISHHLHCANFTEKLPQNVQYSMLSDVFYIVQLTIPLLIIFCTYFNEISDNTFEKVILAFVFITSGSIVISNLIGVSLGSYNNEFIKGNIFQWIFNGYGNYSYSDFASKGFFYFANRVSTVLIMSLPLTVYCANKNNNIWKNIILIFHCTSLIMLGTKVATIGGLLVLITMAIIFVLFKLIRRREVKVSIPLMILIIIISSVWIYILPKSPAIYREQIANNVEKNDENVDINLEEEMQRLEELTASENESELNGENTSENGEKLSQKEKVKYIKENYETMRINPKFILQSYPYESDPDFWLSMFEEPVQNRLDYRYVETKMVQRVKEINNNKMDDYLGIGKSRVESIYNIEQDFVLQYYSLGIVGVILFFGHNIIIFILALALCLYRFKRNFTLENVSLLASIFLTMGVSFLSGNSLDSLFVGIILGFVTGKLLINIFKVKQGAKV